MKTFKPYNPDHLFLLPPALRDWLPEGHLAAIDLYVAPDRQKHGEDASAPVLDDGTVIGAMRAKLQTAAGHVVYALRKAIAEPAFGQIKDARHFRRFSFRGLVKVRAEWLLICLTHNLLKLFRVGWTPHPA